MSSNASAVWPLYVAVADALTNDATVSALLGGDKVYSLKAPTGVDFDYIVLGGVSESEMWAYMSGGAALVLTLHLWCSGVDARRCALLYDAVRRVLNRASLALGASFSPRTSAEVRLVDIQPDPQDPYVHGVVRVELNAYRNG